MLILKQLDLALRGERFNEAAMLLRRCEPQEAQQALALATPYRNKADLCAAFTGLKERSQKGSAQR